ncbi:hypothetical protein CUJ83_01910 [Methanocella sp. CWC-04]|uniref:Uncharacterized protein n=1 Tax=Methanooceanicella nereidis TaxID=2052831 RepID=A0AAP2RBU9_9EURY|nr:hypothetical protein [Methanocella sp. CWC-04]MCD1293750.1 hypothetical protein [Methanocella sp. CWC-04]
MGDLKRLLVTIALVYLFVTITPLAAMARLELAGEIRAFDVIAGNQAMFNKPAITLFHQQTLATNDKEALSISFSDIPADEDAQASCTDLAYPNIIQNSEGSMAATSTGGIFVNWNYVDFINNGGGILSSDATACHPFASDVPVGSNLWFPYLRTMEPEQIKPDQSMLYDNPGSKSIKMVFDPTIGNTFKPITAVSGCEAGPFGTCAMRLEDKTICEFIGGCGREQIGNMSALERMWWNAHAGSRMDIAYKGNMSLPTQLAPLEDPYKIIPHGNHTKILTCALNMTKPGKKLPTKLWDI